MFGMPSMASHLPNGQYETLSIQWKPWIYSGAKAELEVLHAGTILKTLAQLR